MINACELIRSDAAAVCTGRTIYWLRNATSPDVPLTCENCTHLRLGPEINATEVVKAAFLPSKGSRPLDDTKIDIVAAEVGDVEGNNGCLRSPICRQWCQCWDCLKVPEIK